jgi:hypothetical protein
MIDQHSLGKRKEGRKGYNTEKITKKYGDAFGFIGGE